MAALAADPSVVSAIVRSALQYGADPAAMLATALVESGATWHATSDLSYGPFQYRQGGALGSHNQNWAMSPAEVADEAQRFAHAGIHGGRGAAALQRPADPLGYAQKVDAAMGQARSLLGGQRPQNAHSLGASAFGQAQQAQGQIPMFDVAQNAMDANARLAGISAPRLPTILVPHVNAPVQVAPGAAPPPASALGQAVVAAGRHLLGIQYTWGGTTPSTGFDCSGLVKYIYGRLGVSLPRVSEDQFRAGAAVNPAQARPGDLVFFRHANGGVGHVAIYVGNGQVLEAPHTGGHVQIISIQGVGLPVAGVRRYA